MFIVSQILIFIGYVFIGATYYKKKRARLLLFAIISNLIMGIGFCFLSAWVGVGMCAIGICRDTAFFFIDRKRKDPKKITVLDTLLLIGFIAVSVIVTVFTESGIFTWFAMVSTVTHTFALWQRHVFIYRLLGLIVGISWLLYCIYEENVVGVIFEILFFIATVVGIVVYIVQHKKKSEITQAISNNKNPCGNLPPSL